MNEPDPIQELKDANKAKPKKSPNEKLKLERDIFGQEFLGTQPVLRIELDEKDLPPAARDLLFAAAVMYLDDIDFNQIFAEALSQVKPSFWYKKLEVMTPLEWKLIKALEDEHFKSEVEALLEKHLQSR